MSVLSILLELFRAIPEWLRKALLVVFALVVVGEQLARIFHADLPYDEIDQALVIVGGYLGIQSAANVGVTTDSRHKLMVSSAAQTEGQLELPYENQE